LFLYLFLKRGKQILFFSFVYLFFSKYGALIMLDFCFAFLQGVFLSLCTFYYNIFQAVFMSVLIFPHFICYVFLKNLGWKCIERKKNDRIMTVTNLCFFLFFMTIIFVILELVVNLKIGQRIFAYK